MGTRILEGKRINECDKPGAVFYDSTTGQAFGPIFDTGEDAEKFMSFLAGIDPRHLSWGYELSTGNSLYLLWIKAGRKAQRPVYQFDASFLHKTDRRGEWGMSCSFVEHCFPLFTGLKYGNNDVGDILKQAGIVGDAELDTEHSCVYVYFKSKVAGEQFIWRLNGWLRDNWHRAYPNSDEAPPRRKGKK